MKEKGPTGCSTEHPAKAPRKEQRGGTNPMMMPAQAATDLQPASQARLRKSEASSMPSLEYTDEVAAETAPIYEMVKHVIPPIEWPFHAPYISAINKLKKTAWRCHFGTQLPDAGNLPRCG